MAQCRQTTVTVALAIGGGHVTEGKIGIKTVLISEMGWRQGVAKANREVMREAAAAWGTARVTGA